MDELIRKLFNPINYVGKQQILESALNELNGYLEYDGYKVSVENRRCKITALDVPAVEVEHRFELTDDFVHQQFEKLDRKLSENDFDGAIASARSLIEGVLANLHEQITARQLPKSGELRKDFKVVRDLVNLSPDQQTDETVKQILNGLASLVDGLDSLSNQMGDRHRRRYKPEKRHAKLAVHSAKTIVDFLVDTYLTRVGTAPPQSTV